jgi:hypothetical protein
MTPPSVGRGSEQAAVIVAWATGCTRKPGDPGEACLPTGHRAVRKVSADPAKATGAAAAISACTLKTRAAELS